MNSSTIASDGILSERRSGSPLVRGLLLLLPALLLLSILVICTLAVARMSFGEKNEEWSGWSLTNFAAILEPYYLRIFAVTLWYALLSAVITTIISFPLALYMARTHSETRRRIVLICIMLPMLVSLLVQSYGWMAILGPEGLLNRIAGPLLGIERPFSLLFNGTGVMLGLIQTTIPLAVLPMVSSLRAIPPSLEEAAGVLGAPRWKVYRDIIIPIAWPGIAAGSLLVFGFNTGAFVVPLLLGGLKVTTIALAISDQMGTLLNWPMGSALSVMLIVVALAVQSTYRLLGRRANARQVTENE